MGAPHSRLSHAMKKQYMLVKTSVDTIYALVYIDEFFSRIPKVWALLDALSTTGSTLHDCTSFTFENQKDVRSVDITDEQAFYLWAGKEWYDNLTDETPGYITMTPSQYADLATGKHGAKVGEPKGNPNNAGYDSEISVCRPGHTLISFLGEDVIAQSIAIDMSDVLELIQ